MKILISNDGPSAFFYIRHGLAKAFSAAEHQVVIWDINKKSPYDAFDEFEPDIFLGQTYNTTKALCNVIKERPHLKVIMKAGDWGPLSDKIPSTYGILKADAKTKFRIIDLYNETGKPDYLHIYYHPDYIGDTHGHWMKHIPVHSHMLAADVFDYTNGQPHDVFKCDMMFIGGYWEYKARNIDKYLLTLCEDVFTDPLKIKIFGNSHWPVAQYCGFIPQHVVKHALASATICPQIHEPHSTDYGFDMSERTFKLLSNKCFCISDYVEGLEKLFGDDLVFAKTPDMFHKLVYHYINNPQEREPYIQAGYNKVMNEHTYFHRAADIMDNLKLHIHAQNIRETYTRIRNSIDEGNIF